MNFLWHIRGSVSLDGSATNEAALDRVERLLERKRKPIAELTDNQVTFDAPLWENHFTPNWYAMVMYDQGRFWIEQDLNGRTLRYDLRSLHGFVFCLFGAAMFFAFGLAGGGFLDGLKFASFSFGWLYGMNLVLAFARIPSLIRKALRAA